VWVVEFDLGRQIIKRVLDQSRPTAFESTPRLRRRLFGIRRKDALNELESRQSEIDASRTRVHAADAEAERLRKHVDELQAERDGARRELAEIRAGSSPDPESPSGHSKFCDCTPSEAFLQDMARIVSMTEESTRKILENARTTLLRDIDAAEAMREQARAEIAQAVAWRSHWGPMVRIFQKTIREAQGAIDDVPERIRDALAPLTAAAAALDHELLQFGGLRDAVIGTEDGESTGEMDGSDAAPQEEPSIEPVQVPEAVVVGEADTETVDVSDGGSPSQTAGAAVPAP
jgi:hypothetical protein